MSGADDIRAELRRLAEQRERVAQERSRVAADTRAAVRRAKDAGISVTEIARLAGISREHVYDLLKNDG